MVTYCTVQEVKNEIQNYDTSCTDAMITQFIEHAEAVVDATMGESFISIYDSSKVAHRLIRFATIKLALIDLIKWDLTNQFGTSIGSIQLDLARESANRALTLLANKRVVKFMKGETH